MTNLNKSIKNQQPLASSTNGNSHLPDGSPQLQPATIERMVNIAAGGTIGVAVGMFGGIALAFLKNGMSGGAMIC